MNIIQKILAQNQQTQLNKGSTIIGINQPENFKVSDVGTAIKNVINASLVIAALVAFIYLILGGIQWITSGGDKSAMESARNKITQAIVGLIIVAAAYAVMNLVSSFLGLNITNLDIGNIYK